ncbi:glucose dehydrogenase [FAD, quinone]-like isoform X2 [Tachypleus tridentatus]|uniref:glucose dehydrogenase [FAD, quinone]-like isoform X2 n=1 Tax=Tachypleus tridentatus TaxID=6853 RepID=UPI003FD0B511
MPPVFSLLGALLPIMALLFFRSTDRRIQLPDAHFDMEYDYIIVGAGSAGATLASRLSEEPNTSILLLEAGGLPDVLSSVPLLSAELQLTKYDWAFKTVPQEAACFGLKGKRSLWPRGKGLGGTSLMNYMLYIRGNPRDYDKWAEHGARGWSWQEVLPYFLKSEDNRDPLYAFNGYHGIGGPQTVDTPPYISPLGQAFVEAGMSLGYLNIDLNGPHQTGFSVPQGTIRNGRRCSVSKAYIEPALGRKNLNILLQAHVTKILFDSHRWARAVKFLHKGLPRVVFARKEIILSAGTINTPQILMLSGIGPRHHLETLGIPVIANLPVGKNLHDHVGAAGIHFLIDQQISIIPTRFTRPAIVQSFFLYGKGPLTMLGGVEGLGFIRTGFSNSSDDYPDSEIHFISSSPSSDGGRTIRKVQGVGETLWKQVYQPYLYRDSFSMYPVLLRPKSRGYIKLRSADPHNPPVINPRYLTHPDDIRTLVEAMKISIDVGQSEPFRRFKARMFETVFPGCERFPVLSDSYLECVARTYTITIYHPVGTCKMGDPSDPSTVVDSELRCSGFLSVFRDVAGSLCACGLPVGLQGRCWFIVCVLDRCKVTKFHSL